MYALHRKRDRIRAVHGPRISVAMQGARAVTSRSRPGQRTPNQRLMRGASNHQRKKATWPQTRVAGKGVSPSSTSPARGNRHPKTISCARVRNDPRTILCQRRVKRRSVANPPCVRMHVAWRRAVDRCARDSVCQWPSNSWVSAGDRQSRRSSLLSSTFRLGTQYNSPRPMMP